MSAFKNERNDQSNHSGSANYACCKIIHDSLLGDVEVGDLNISELEIEYFIID
jgi:hypothetical protein